MHVQKSLLCGWSVDSFKFHGGESLQDSDDAKLLQHADAAIKSSVFWGYCSMMRYLGDVVLQLFAYLEGCCCHDDLQDRKSKQSRHQTASATNIDFAMPACPMRGMRAPHLAVGSLWCIFSKLMAMANGWLYADVVGLSKSDAQSIISDFALARQALEMTLRLKMSFWEALPHQLCALAHERADIVRDAAQRALSLYTACTDNERSHPLVQRWFMSCQAMLEQWEEVMLQWCSFKPHNHPEGRTPART